MATWRGNPNYADGTPGATDRIMFETAGNLPRGVVTTNLPATMAIAISHVSGLQTALDGKYPAVLTDVQKTAHFTFALTDAQKMVRANHASTPITATVPANATVAFPLGTVLNVMQRGAAAVTIAAAGGVTINKPVTKTFVIGEQYNTVFIWKESTDVWILDGPLASA